MNAVNTLDDKDVVESYQTTKQLLSMATGIGFCFIFIALIVRFLSFLSDSFWYWLLILIFSYSILRVGFELFLRLYKSPLKLSINRNIVTISFLFRKKQVIKASDITRLESNKLLSLFIPSSGRLVYSSNRFVIAKPFYENFDAFVGAINEQNQNCSVDEKLLKWDGPRSMM